MNTDTFSKIKEIQKKIKSKEFEVKELLDIQSANKANKLYITAIDEEKNLYSLYDKKFEDCCVITPDECINMIHNAYDKYINNAVDILRKEIDVLCKEVEDIYNSTN